MASSSNSDAPFKIVLCGEEGVGKTAIYHRLKDDKFYDCESRTDGNDECMLTITCKRQQARFNLFDTAGMEKFDSYTRSYFKNCHAVIMVYSGDVKTSLTTASKCLQLAKDYAAGAKLVLVQNKIDLPDSHKESSELEDLKSQVKFEFKVSAKEGQGTKEMMKKLGKYFVKHRKQYNTGNKKCIVQVQSDGRPRHRRCCSSN